MTENLMQLTRGVAAWRTTNNTTNSEDTAAIDGAMDGKRILPLFTLVTNILDFSEHRFLAVVKVKALHLLFL